MYVLVRYRRQLQSFNGKIWILITIVEEIWRKEEHILMMKIPFVASHLEIVASYFRNWITYQNNQRKKKEFNNIFIC